ncbi:disulfide bond formation protein DsbB [Shewanella surugensis]|uniref:Disulfide bond formation protein B n=1 Tax=Shewanella surugensis TaxID=212020 RepID=A0ABT0L6T4_9GAMM|nr:disulfide bond formation protein DsbB [Shewanella surugensis]MCL1123380.1 disulfide bond formation protein DsbB [Shewanella surugensis]
MKTLVRFSQSRIAWLSLTFSALLLEIIALFFQYGMQLNPCVMCIYQRLAMIGLIVAGVIGSLAYRSRFMRFIAIILWGVSSIWGLKFAIDLVDLQTNPSPFATCAFLPEFPSWMPLHEWIPSIFMPSGMCTDAPWIFGGFSMGQWMIGIFSAYCIALVIFIIPALRKNVNQPTRPMFKM